MAAHDDQFSAALLESMDDAIRSLLSQDVLDAFHSNLLEKRSIAPKDIPNQLPTVSIVLRGYFGPSSETIEKATAQRLFSKYGLEFHKHDSAQLSDYVEKARNELNFATTIPTATPEPATGDIPLRDDFDRIFVESVKETIEDLLGKDQAKLAFRMLEREVLFDKLMHHLPTFYSALRTTFGKDSGRIETAIARKLYLKLSLQFIETPMTELGKYVEAALLKLDQRERDGFFTISDAK